MMDWAKARPTGSLFVQLLTLTGLTLVLAWAMSSLLLFMLPPPAPDFYRLAQVERTFPGAPITFAARKPLQRITLSKAPSPALDGQAKPAHRPKLAPHPRAPAPHPVLAGRPRPACPPPR